MKKLLAFMIVISVGYGSFSQVVDIDNNKYEEIAIGNQVWMKSDLKVKRYQNGDSIRMVTSPSEWKECIAKKIGAGYPMILDSTDVIFFNWYVVTDTRGVCPSGWHIPLTGEFEELLKKSGNNAGDCFFRLASPRSLKYTILYSAPRPSEIISMQNETTRLGIDLWGYINKSGNLSWATKFVLLSALADDPKKNSKPWALYFSGGNQPRHETYVRFSSPSYGSVIRCVKDH